MTDWKNIKVTYWRLSDRIRDLLLSPKSRKFLVFLFFFFIATFFWLLQTLNDTYETEIRMPLRLKDVPESIIITSAPPDELTLKVRDKGSTLLNYLISRNINPVELDFKDYPRANNRLRIYAADFRRDLQAQLAPSSELLSVDPDTLEYVYTNGLPKKVPVSIPEPLMVESQYYISNITASPDSVLVYAPAAQLRNIRAVETVELALAELTDTLRKEYALQPIKDAKLVPDKVTLTLAVDVYTEKSVEVEVAGIGFPTDKALRTFPSKIQVSFQIGMSRFKSVTAADFRIEVNYRDIVRATTDRLSLELTRMPSGIHNVRIQPEQIEYLIEDVQRHDTP